jgi:hypothetical protein
MTMTVICFVNNVIFSVYNGFLSHSCVPGIARGVGAELCDRPRQHSPRSGKMCSKMNILNDKIENLHSKKYYIVEKKR